MDTAWIMFRTPTSLHTSSRHIGALEQVSNTISSKLIFSSNEFEFPEKSFSILNSAFSYFVQHDEDDSMHRCHISSMAWHVLRSHRAYAGRRQQQQQLPNVKNEMCANETTDGGAWNRNRHKYVCCEREKSTLPNRSKKKYVDWLNELSWGEKKIERIIGTAHFLSMRQKTQVNFKCFVNISTSSFSYFCGMEGKNRCARFNWMHFVWVFWHFNTDSHAWCKTLSECIYLP